jgi:hypothetical protein
MATAKARLYGPALVATGPTTLWTAPATELDVIQTIWVSNPTASAVSLTVSITADAAGTRIIGTNTAANIPANSVTPFYGPWIVNPGEIVTASAGTTNVLVITFNGEKRTPG